VAVVALMAVFAFMPETQPADAEIARRPGSHATR
jgi:hypothetical protein